MEGRIAVFSKDRNSMVAQEIAAKTRPKNFDIIQASWFVDVTIGNATGSGRSVGFRVQGFCHLESAC